MKNRETIMTWLEICGKNRDCSATCPYGDGTGEDYASRCREDLMADAFDLLKKQEAQTQSQRKDIRIIPAASLDGWKCRICFSKIAENQKVCHSCGYGIKW